MCYLKAASLAIVSIAVYDIYCTVRLADSLTHCEQNPIALLLVDRKTVSLYVANPLNDELAVEALVRYTDVSNLVLAKTIGLVLSIWVMDYVIRTKRKTIAASILLPVLCAAIALLISLVHHVN